MKAKKTIGLLMGVLVLAGAASAGVIYQDDFAGAATSNPKDTVMEVTPVGVRSKYLTTGLDGNGHLESTDAGQVNANYRVQMGQTPLTADASITEIKYTVTMRTPVNDFVIVGFHEASVNGLVSQTANGGPMMEFQSNGNIVMRGGTYNQGRNKTYAAVYTPGDIITAEMTYHPDTLRVDLDINGSVLATGLLVNHEYPAGTLADPVVSWVQMHLRNQPSAANGGAYIDSMQVSTIPEPAMLGLVGFVSLAMLFVRRQMMM